MAIGSGSSLTFLGVAGSLRRASYNRGLIRAAIEVAPARTRVIPYELYEIPMFDADVEAEGDPAAVADFKRAIAGADALLIQLKRDDEDQKLADADRKLLPRTDVALEE